MKKFLQQVAEAYYDNERLRIGRYTFVFPNRRAGSFFLHYLRQRADRPTVTPEVTTMGELVASVSDATEVSPIEAMFILYNCYRELSGEIPDFDHFRFWGESILDDFDDVDMNLVDPSEIFRNVKAFKEISSNYLTGEQRAVIERYWPESFRDMGDGSERFWKHVGGDTPSQHNFLRLWEMLAPLYTRFHECLRGIKLATRGMFHRQAAMSALDAFGGSRYVFVGFSRLSISELRLMERLKAAGRADFYWKCAAPWLFSGDGGGDGGFVGRYAAGFPSLYDLENDDTDDSGGRPCPKIDIVSAPSRVAQAELCGATVARWIGEHRIKDPANAIDTAIVLPDENMLIPTIGALPGDIPLNVTMGVPMRQTPVASFMSDIMSLNLRARRVTTGETVYFHEDVRCIVSNPFVKAIAQDECHDVMALLAEKRLFAVPVPMLMEMTDRLSVIFTTVPDSGDFAAVSSYMTSLLDFIAGIPGGFGEGTVENFYLNAYRTALSQLNDAVRRHGVDMRGLTAFHLLERGVGMTTIRFEGQPLRGLQIMGVLETRALDFDNIIVLSMNENIFPRKHYRRSFIPDNLRTAYGLPTARHDEAAYAYYFHSMIARARNVTFYYDSRKGASGGGAGEMSRYLQQLLYLSDAGTVSHRAAVFGTPAPDDQSLTVIKTPRIMARLDRFRSQGDDRRYLSASAINDYISCPLRFYLTRVEELNQEPEITEYIDASIYGSVVHRVAENLYRRIRGNRGSVMVTAADLDLMIADSRSLDSAITEAVNYCHNKLGTGCYKVLTGESRVLAILIRRIILKMLAEERQFAPFEFIAAEVKDECLWEITPSLTVNFKMYIDRIDRVTGRDGIPRLRFVDYKTGADPVRFSDVGQLFDDSGINRRKAILQLYLYCGLYSRNHDYDGPIQPYIYQLRTLFVLGLEPLLYNRIEVTDYRPLADEVFERTKTVVEEIFDPAVAFRQAASEHACMFCTFKPLCNRQRENKT